MAAAPLPPFSDLPARRDWRVAAERRPACLATATATRPWLHALDLSPQRSADAPFHMRRIHSPVLLANVEDAKARAFVVLFTCDAFARAILISLVPLQAYDLLGAAQLVSVVYFLVGILGLAANLTVPLFLHRLRRRWVLTIGAGAQVASALMFALGTKASLVAGLALQVLAMAMLGHPLRPF